MTVEDSREFGSNLRFSQKLDLIARSSAILAAVHHAGISNNDVKPDNIVLDDQLNFTMIDWGKANAIGEEQEIGDERYQAPEISKQDQSDVYSLQKTMFNIIGPRYLLNTEKTIVGERLGSFIFANDKCEP